MCVVFFFQAEDGIRDSPVTGVQTCALPIFSLQHDAKQTRPDPRAATDHRPLYHSLHRVRRPEDRKSVV